MGKTSSQTALAAFGEQAHRKTVEADIADIAGFLSENFGQKMVAYLADVSDPKTVSRWASGEQKPRHAAEERLRSAYQAFQLLQSADSPHTVRAWFIGLNPQLKDHSPARAVREGLNHQVIVAAKSFMAGG
jgi:hypothetical protein